MRLRNLTFVVFGIILFVSCRNENEVDFGFNACYVMQNGEQVIGVNQAVEDEYALFYKVGEHTIPLNKAIKAPNYRTYIGIAIGVNSNSKMLYETYLSDPQLHILTSDVNNSGDVSKYRLFQKQDSVYNFTYISNIANPDLTMVYNYVAEDSALIQKMYADSKFPENRMNCE